MDKFALHLSSGVIAVSAYLLLLIFLVFKFSSENSNPTRYSFAKETTFEVSLMEVKPEIKPEVQKLPPKEEKKVEEIPVTEESASRTPHVGLGVNKLFAQVDAKVPVKEIKPADVHDPIAKKKKSDKPTQKDTIDESLQKILSDVNVKNTMSFNVPAGQYDEFYAKVNEILYTHWNPSGFSYKEESKVIITITAAGKFNYKISRKSGNSAFDSALEEFLEKMKTVDFPPFPRGDKTNIEVTFKTEGQV
ncbi:energy transducer TonB [Wolinella succinogenes]|jgi:protein TonB|uniref:energy transducer TonB n=1 Tax=Wolinella succinogenes TaxID=844 RepID=UPI002FC74C94